MKIIGCDFHPGYQQIAMLDLATGEMVASQLTGKNDSPSGIYRVGADTECFRELL